MRRAIPRPVKRTLKSIAVGMGRLAVQEETDRLAALLNEPTAHVLRAVRDTQAMVEDLVELRSGGGEGRRQAAVEAPYALRALAALPAGSRVLQLGGPGEGLAVPLASLGYRVALVGGEPVAHPGISGWQPDFWQLDPEPADLGAVVALSSLDEVANAATAPSTARSVLERLRPWCAPGATLVLAVPAGGEPLGCLLEGWAVEDVTIAGRVGPSAWRTRPAGVETAPGAEAVALVTARVT